MKKLLFLLLSSVICHLSSGQNVGIGTATPNANALLHVDLATSTTKGLLVTGTYNFNSTVPDLAAGSRMMFYPGKAAFRVGSVNGTQWNNSSVGIYSVAMGVSTTASGMASTAMGSTTTASGIASTALGLSTRASGYSSTTMGYQTRAKGYASTVVGMYNDSVLTSDENSYTTTTPLFIVGNGNADNSRSNAMVVRKDGNVGIGTSAPNANAQLHVDHGTSTTKGLLITGTNDGTATVPDLGAGTRMMFYPGKAAFRAGYIDGNQWNNSSVGLFSVAMGRSTIASGQSSTAIGYSTTGSGFSSTAIGQSTTASGDYSTAMGHFTTASRAYSTAMGVQTTASGFISTAMGYQTKAKGYASTVVGMYNDSLLTSDETNVTTNTPLFIVGNGNADNSRSNAMVVRKDGNVGIGTSAPNANALLHVDLGTSATKGLLVTGTLDFDQLATVPDLGAGTKMMFYPGKAAFRVGYSDGTKWNNSSVGGFSVAMGINTTASGNSSTAMGSYTTASGWYSTAMGISTTGSGYSSTAMGQSTTASGHYSTAMGLATKAKGYSSTVVGLYNDSLLTSDQISVTSTTPLFIVGNGNDFNSRSNAMVVRKDGNVGIGTNSPSQKLEVSGSIRQQVFSQGINVAGNTGTSFTWTHNLGYQPVIMISLDQTGGGYLDYVSFSYQHLNNNQLNIYLTNRQGNTATGTVKWIVVY